MATLNTRGPYTPEELSSLYPSNLKLHQVHVIFRHGERSPVSSRFENTGLTPFWPYCSAASKFKAAVLEGNGDWSTLAYQRRTETFGKNSEAVIAKGAGGEQDGICLMGELTDTGRGTTLRLGQRLRKLYIEQLKFLPEDLGVQSEYYLRTTPLPRALESLQQVFIGLYPAPYRTRSAPLPIIHERSMADENLFPNDANCRRFLQLSREFAKLAAEKWNNSPEMQHLKNRIGKWVPDGHVAVDGHPRLSGIMDTVNATLSHGPATRLPAEFYEEEVRRNMEMINLDEWFRGYSQSSEYRKFGVGTLLGDVVDRMIVAADAPEKEGRLKVALMGCHDTTLAGLLTSLGAFDGIWPPFTSSIAFEMFRKRELEQSKSLWSRLLGGGKGKEEGYYVRLRYNDKPVVVKGCRKLGNHLEGDESFCTMAAFKEIVNKMRPKDWEMECLPHIDQTGIPPVEEVE